MAKWNEIAKARYSGLDEEKRAALLGERGLAAYLMAHGAPEAFARAAEARSKQKENRAIDAANRARAAELAKKIAADEQRLSMHSKSDALNACVERLRGAVAAGDAEHIAKFQRDLDELMAIQVDDFAQEEE